MCHEDFGDVRCYTAKAGRTCEEREKYFDRNKSSVYREFVSIFINMKIKHDQYRRNYLPNKERRKSSSLKEKVVRLKKSNWISMLLKSAQMVGEI